RAVRVWGRGRAAASCRREARDRGRRLAGHSARSPLAPRYQPSRSSSASSSRGNRLAPTGLEVAGSASPALVERHVRIDQGLPSARLLHQPERRGRSLSLSAELETTDSGAGADDGIDAAAPLSSSLGVIGAGSRTV